MASTVTLGSLKTQTRQRANMENSNFVTDAELVLYINSAIQELYDMLVEAAEDYYTISSSIVCDGVTSTYAVPSGFYKLMGVDYTLGSDPIPMEKYTFLDRNRYSSSDNRVVRYRLIKDSIVFQPIPAAQTMTLWYIPAFTPLALDADLFDGINGWEDFVTTSAAIICMMKEESDVSALLIEKQGIEKRIEAMRFSRDQGTPERVGDVYSKYYNPRTFNGF